jgi:excisionase family DNA binding protein
MTNAMQITTAQIAEFYGVSVRTIHRWVAAGRLTPTGKLPGKTGHYLFDPSALNQNPQERAA